MPVSDQFFHLLSLLSAIPALVSAWYYGRFRIKAGKWGSVFLIFVAVEMISYSMQWMSVSTSFSNFWFIVQSVSYYSTAPIWFFFINELSRSELKIKPLPAVILCSIPSLILVPLLMQNGNVLSALQADLQAPVSVARIAPIFGGWAVYLVYFYFTFKALSLFRIVRYMISPYDIESRPLLYPMFIGTIALIILFSIELSGKLLIKDVSVLQVGFAFVSVFFFIYYVIYKAKGIVPIDRANVFAIMRDGCILLDHENRVIDINPQAEKILNVKSQTIKYANIGAIWPPIAQTLQDQKTKGKDDTEIITTFEIDSNVFQVSITKYQYLNGQTIGRLININNITDRDRLELALVERNQLVAQSNTLLQEFAETNLVIQAAADLPAIYDGLQTGFAKIGLDYFIATPDPVSDEIMIEYVSVKSNMIERFEKAAGFQLKGLHLQRSLFPDLYAHLHQTKRDHISSTCEGLLSVYNTKLSPIINAALRKIGFDPATPIVIFRLTAGAHKIGLMGIWGNGVSQDNLNPFRIFTSQVAWAIERINLYTLETQRGAELERSNQLIAALANVSAQLGKSSDLNSSLEILGRELEAIGLHCIIGDLDDKEEFITFQYASFINKIKSLGKRVPGFKFIGYRLPRKMWPPGGVISEGVPRWHVNVSTLFGNLFPMIPGKVFELALLRAGITAEDNLCILPLIMGGKVTGVLPVWGKGVQTKDTPTLMVFAHQVSEILRKTEDYENETKRADSLERSNKIITALSNVSASLETTASLSEIFKTLGKELRKVNVNCMVGTLDEEKQSMKIEYLSIQSEVTYWASKLGAFWPSEIRIPRKLWPTDKAVVERVPYWDPKPIGHTSKMFPFIPKNVFIKSFELAGMSPDDSVCYLPMISENDVIGILAVWGHELKGEDIPALSVFANQVTTAIHNGTLYNQAQDEIINRTQAEAKIQASLVEKEILLKEVHHRVKNNLQIISSLLNLQMGQSKDAASLEGLRESQNRVRAMALIHEKLYQSTDLARINFSSYINSLTTSLAQTYRLDHDRVALKVETDDILLDLDTAIPCGLVVNELVSNSLKYAFPDGRKGTIRITCRQDKDGSYSLVVSDNGIGMADQISLAKNTSLGLKLVSNLVRQIDGQLTVDGKKGSRFEITFSQTKKEGTE